MAKKPVKAPKWPKRLAKKDELLAMYDDDGNVIYLIYSSADKKDTFVRDNGSWVRVNEQFFLRASDLSSRVEEVGIGFIAQFDKEERIREGQDSRASTAYRNRKNAGKRGMVAAVGDECPIATQDITINLKNRKNAIDVAMYGPLNPAEPNEEYWQKLADEWSVDTETAKKQRCGNCAVFIVTSSMKECISTGLTGKSGSDEFDMIDAAGELGYCEAFDFKCASARTCRAWVSGGPIDDEAQASRSAKK